MSQHPDIHAVETASAARRMGGFSLIEVMVALIIIAVGMLGIAKMQALALSTTESSGTRSLVAIEAASLAASMHTNRDYWVSNPPPPSFTVNVSTTGPGSTSVTISDATLGATQDCAASACSPSQVAAYDVQQWGAALGQVVAGAQATITCNSGAVPLSCTIQIAWQENVTSANNSAAAAGISSGALNLPQYTLYVEP
ncbi:MAG TPA: type IV pilus modification protein PilV [Steroidobacteraceae bacterium]|nr:type IV pilus modification protein PilV [Steroidobacteraceae bacterium]